MNVLIGCEESQVVTNAFRRHGHNAYSCDLLPTRGNPDWHYQSDVKKKIIFGWDLIILHPDCTAMAVSGNRWYGKGTAGYQKRLDAIEWTVNLWELAKANAHRVALENPVSVIFSHIPASQYIQPWQFGHPETKKTGLALHNLDTLQPTNIVEGRENRIWRMAPSDTRKRDRSETYLGIAQAMAEQWG